MSLPGAIVNSQMRPGVLPPAWRTSRGVFTSFAVEDLEPQNMPRIRKGRREVRPEKSRCTPAGPSLPVFAALPAARFFRYNQPEVSCQSHAPLAQLDRASGYEPEGREFESLRAHHRSILRNRLEILRCAQDFGRRLPLRLRLLNASSSNLSGRTI